MRSVAVTATTTRWTSDGHFEDGVLGDPDGGLRACEDYS